MSFVAVSADVQFEIIISKDNLSLPLPERAGSIRTRNTNNTIAFIISFRILDICLKYNIYKIPFLDFNVKVVLEIYIFAFFYI